MTLLQDIADERNFGPEEGRRDWQEIDRFSPPTEAIDVPVLPSYDEIRDQEIAHAREEAYLAAQNKLERDEY